MDSLFERFVDLSPEKRMLLLKQLKKQTPAPPLTEEVRVRTSNQLPLSFSQQRLWFLDQLTSDNTAYSICSAWRLSGELNVSALRQTLNEIVKRHEILRTTFLTGEDDTIQHIAPSLTLPLPIEDLSALSEAERETRIPQAIAEQTNRAFNLTLGPLLRVILLKLQPYQHVLVLTIHHIVSDEWSMGILCRELTAHYNAFSSNQTTPLPDLTLQYADYTVKQHEWFAGQRRIRELLYWQKQLADRPEMLHLPTNNARPAVQTYCGASEVRVLPFDLSERLQKLCQQEGVTLFMALLTLFMILLYRYTGQEDLLVGTPIAGRTRIEEEELIGFFVNTLVLRGNLAENPGFRTMLSRMRAVTLDAYASQNLPFEALVEALIPTRSLSYHPLFQVMFVLQNEAEFNLNLVGITDHPLEIEDTTARFDLTLYMGKSAQGLTSKLVYSTDLFAGSTIARMLKHLQVLLEHAVTHPDQQIGLLPLLTEHERHQLLVDFNNTYANFDNTIPIHRLMENQVSRDSEAIALVFEGKQTTYGEINRKANQLGHYLQKLGVGPEVYVCLYLERSVEMIVAILGTLKAGGVYVPLEPAYPEQRLLFMLVDTQPRVVLTQESLVAKLPPNDAQIVCLDTIWLAITGENRENMSDLAQAENLAYIIYTSGSTGRPKGAMNTHRGMCNRLLWGQKTFCLTKHDILLLEASFSFDASVWELFWPLLVGASIVLTRPGELQNSDYLIDTILEQQVSVIHVTPALLLLLIENPRFSLCTSVRYIFSGGDVLPLTTQKRCLTSLDAALINQYGPSEAASNASYWQCKEDVRSLTIPIGHPIANTQIYLLDSWLQPVPIGVTGELYIGGAGLGRGYLKREDITADKFIPHPFSNQPGDRLYRTGDLARYRTDGQIEYLGRIDHQVKIRGFRIEPGEVEITIRKHPAIKDTVVTTSADALGQRQLVAYVVTKPDHHLSATELRNFLAQHLPEYLIPTIFITLEALPFAQNGKLDRNALPASGGTRTELQGMFVPPRDALELKLMQLWEQILNVRPIGMTDNFFTLGGHSLVAVRLIIQLKKRFQRDLPLAILFQDNGATIENMARHLRQQVGPVKWNPLVKLQPAGTRRNLFFVHPVGGTVFCYLALAHALGSDQPFYGLQARGIEDEEEPYTNIEDMATQYIQALQVVQPEGPYLLGGWSFGGCIAFEMAQQLQRQQHEVALLALVDSWAPTPFSIKKQEDDAALLMRFVKDLGSLSAQAIHITPDELRKLSPDKQLYHILEQAQLANTLSPDMDLAYARRLFQVFKAHTAALQHYVPLPYPGQVTLFRAIEQIESTVSDATPGWQALASGGVNLHLLAGDHYTIIRKPRVEALAQILRTFF